MNRKFHTAEDIYSANLYNPAVEGYLETHDWSENGWEPTDDTTPLSKYPEYVPTDRAIQNLEEYSPIVEVGAGSGYWAHVANENNATVHPTDIGWTNWTYNWAEVEEKDHTCVLEYPESNVLLCHPPGTTWPTDLLELLQEDQHLIYVGGWGPSPDATLEFFNQLQENWELVDTFPVFDWASQNACGYIFSKLATRESHFSQGTRRMHIELANAKEARISEDKGFYFERMHPYVFP